MQICIPLYGCKCHTAPGVTFACRKRHKRRTCSRAFSAYPLVGVRERTDAGLPTVGQRAADRTSLAAGAVLGAVGAVARGSIARGIRSLLRRR